MRDEYFSRYSRSSTQARQRRGLPLAATPPAPQPPGTTMLYNRHSDNELERAVYIDPSNSAARAEMIRRVPGLMGERGGEITEMEVELANANKDHALEVDELKADHDSLVDAVREDLADAEKHVTDLTGELEAATCKLAAANVRIASLTHAEDLV